MLPRLMLACFFMLFAGSLVVGCGQGEGQPCQIHGDCMSGNCCGTGGSLRGVCRAPGVTACGSSQDATAGDDAGPDANVDAPMSFDAGSDADEDAGADANVDGGSDAGSDGGPDAGSDAGSDASADVGVDATNDAG